MSKIMSKRMPTSLAERIYSVLVRYAEAHPDYYQKESFIFHFGVCSNKSMTYNLTCLDGNERSFSCVEDRMWIQGKGSNRVNSIIKKILEEDTEEVLKFKSSIHAS